MDELFGAPVSVIVLVLAVLFAFMLAFLTFIALRDPILVRMAMRNVRRRPTRAALIVVGLMLATAIISAAFTTGDSITFSIKRNATDSLRMLDEFIRVDEDSDVWEEKAVPDEFPQAVFEQIREALEADPDVDGVVPALVKPVAVINTRGRQFEVNALLTGVEPGAASRFEALFDVLGNPADLSSLAPGEVFIDAEGASALDANTGDVLGVALGPGELKQLTVRAVIDGWYFKRSSTKVVLMLPLLRAQELLDRQGLLSSVLISNRGDALAGEKLTGEVLDRLGTLPPIAEAGLEIFDVKRQVVEEANQIGSLFVSFFTTFGLFSIGVGLLLIFLIFSMLAAERKSEMGMSRALGMQRRHLVRLFIAEGAIYGLGSAVVGALMGIGLGVVLVIFTAGIFSADPTEEFTLTPHVELQSVLMSFLIGSLVTFVTVIFASVRVSRLNIVRAIRDIPEPQLARAGRMTLIWGVLITALGAVVLWAGLQGAQLTAFGLGVSLVPLGIALILRWRGVAQRLVLSGTGLFLLVYWLLPPSVYNRIREDWNQDFSIFFLSGAMLVTGAVLVLVNNSRIVLGAIAFILGKIRGATPVIKPAISHPMRFGFRTGLSIAMFAVVIFSVTVMSTVIEGFNKLFDDQERLAGGYDVIGFTHGDLNPIVDLASTVGGDPNLSFVAVTDGRPSVGTLRTVSLADARLSADGEGQFVDTMITGLDDDFLRSNRFTIKLATSDYVSESGFDAGAVWRDLRDKSGLAIVNAFIVPTRNGRVFDISADTFDLNEVDGLFLENETMEPVGVTVRDLETGTAFDLTIIGVFDDLASGGPIPGGIYTSTRTLEDLTQRRPDATQFFFNTVPGTEDPAKRLEAALFQHGVETLDVAETIDSFQSSQRSFFNLLIAFMLLGLIVGTVALGVISARAVVERRREIGVMRAIGFSRGMIQMIFIVESSFIGLLGIGLGLTLGLLTSINLISDIRIDEPSIQLIFPWLTLIAIGAGAYLFTLVTIYLPAAQAARTAPAEAIRAE